MGVGVQASCYCAPHCAPLDWQQGNNVTNAANGSTSAISNWQQEIEGLLDELQIMALTMTLDANTFSSSDELNAEFRRIEMNFFAPWFDTQRMKRVFRKLGQDVLRRTLQNAPLSSSARAISTEYLLDRYQDHHIRIPLASHIRKGFPLWKSGRDCMTTWREFYELTQNYPRSERIEEMRIRQHAEDQVDLGMTSRAALSPENEAKIRHCLESPDPSLFSKAHVVDVVKETGDMVIIRAATLPENDRGVALSWDNIITLGPLFFSAPRAGSMSTASITAGHTRVDALARESRLTILLHEFLHVESVANLYDMPITKDEIDAVMERWQYNSRPQAGLVHIPPSMRGHQSRKAYGMDYCTCLLVQDYWQGTTRTEKNCDSWTLCTVLKQLALANPEYDFLSQGKVVRRESLLHHCTLYNCMRPETAARIQDLPGYDARQDLWARNHGDWTPENAKKLLEVLQTMVEEAGIDLDRILKETGIDIQDGRLAVATSTLNNMGPAE